MTARVCSILFAVAQELRRLYDREFWFVTSILLILESVFFYRQVFLGQALVATDILYTLPPWSAVKVVVPQSPWPSDIVLQFQPWRQFAAESFRRGVVPLWNPYNYAGTPFLGNIQTALFFPLSMLYYVLPYGLAETVVVVLKLYIAGISMYYLTRHLGLSRFGSLFSSITFAFCGFLVVWLDCAFTNSAIFLPLLFLAACRLQKKPTGRRFAELAAVTGLQILGGGIEVTAFSLVAVTSYFVYCLAIQTKRDLRFATLRRGLQQIALLLLAVMMGMCLSAIELLPFAHTLVHSYVWSVRSTHGGGSPWPNVISLLMPNFLGLSSGHAYWGAGFGSFPETNGGYVGPIALTFAIIAVVNSMRRSHVSFFALLGAVTSLVAYDFPLVSVYALTRSQLFTVTANGRLLLVIAFSLAVLAGYGVDAVLSHKPFNLVVTISALTILVLVALSAVLFALGGTWGWALDSAVLFAVVGGFLLFSASVVVTLTICQAFTINIARAREVGLRLLLLLLLVVSLFSLGISYNPTQPTATYPSAPAIDFLQKDHSIYRFLSLQWALLPNANLEYKLFSVRGYDSMVAGLFSYLEERVGSVRGMISVQWFESYNSSALNIMNVKYIVAPLGVKLAGPRFISVYADASVEIFLNSECLPRAFLAHDFRVITDEAAALTTVAETHYTLGPQTILLGPMASDELLPTVSSGTGDTMITLYEVNKVILSVVTSSPALLFIADSYYPGWQAYVDASRVHIYRANYAFRAIVVPSGSHVVEFSYEPEDFFYGVLVSSVAALILVSASVSRVSVRKLCGSRLWKWPIVKQPLTV